MTEGNSKTPYNSIYETLTPKNPKAEAEVVCCKHGCLCPYGRKPVENQYVNLPSPSKEQQVAEKLAAKLEKLKVKESKIGGSKEKRKKEKRQQSETVVDDNHAYEMMGPPAPLTERSTASSAPVTTESLENNFKTDNTASSTYIGVQCTADAETHVTRRGEFAIYHLSEPGACINNLTSSLPLMLVYYTTTKKHRHYPIRSSGTASEPQFSVDCGYPIVRKHFSLNQLVQYYKTFGSIQIHPDDTCSDSFSWWLE